MILRHIFLCGLIFSPAAQFQTLAAPFPNDPAGLLQSADQLYRAQNFEMSITEYWRFLFFHSDHPYSFYAYYKAGMAHTQLCQWDFAISLFRRALQQSSVEWQRQRIRYQLSLTLIAKGEYDLAQLELFKLFKVDSSIAVVEAATLLYGLLLVYQQNWAEAKTVFAEARHRVIQTTSAAAYLEKIEARLEQLTHRQSARSPKLAKWLSTFIPGSGQLYAGSWLQGFNAMALNAGTGYLLWGTYDRQSVRDFILVFSFIWLRYYSGNRLHAEEAAIRANHAHQEKVIQQIYDFLKQASAEMSTEVLTIEWHHLHSFKE